MTIERNTTAIQKIRKKVSESTREDILNAIVQLKNNRKPINKSSVAKQAGCSRTTIYKHTDILEQIEGIESRAKNNKRKKTDELFSESRQNRDDRIKLQYEKIKQLENEIHLAMIQLVKMEDLRRENASKSEIIERLLNQKNNLEKEILQLKAKQNKDVIRASKVVDLNLKSK